MSLFKIWICISSLYLVLSNGQKFEKQIESHTRCSSDRDCLAHSICVGNTIDNTGFCTCVKGYLIEKNRTHYECFKEAEHLNDPCKIDVQCMINLGPHAICSSGTCQCEPNAHFYTKQCWRTIKLGDICNFTENCLLKTGQLAYCVEGRCSCNASTHAVSDASGESCELSFRLGDTCSNDQQCVTSNSRCITVCRCKPGFTTNYDETECLKASSYLDSDCREDGQCEGIEHSICTGGKCRCRNKYHGLNNVCYKSVELGQNCESVSECITNSNVEETVECGNGVCTCKQAYVQKGKICSNTASTQKSFNILTIILGILFLYLTSL